MNSRFAAALLAWRTERGYGDPARFPQDEAARDLRDAGLKVSLRTYQNWEWGKTMPRRWTTIDAVLDHIGADRLAVLPPPATPDADEPEGDKQS